MEITMEFFDKYGKILVKAVRYEDLRICYGPLFVKWYRKNYEDKDKLKKVEEKSVP